MTPSFPQLPITDCPDGAGTLNSQPNGGLPAKPVTVNPYTPPDLCIGEFRITQGECADIENSFQESLAAENLAISGVPINVFKLLGVHEQGKLIDLTGQGTAISSSGTATNAFDALAGDWVSVEQGMTVVTKPAWIGYDLGIRKTSFGQPENAPAVGATQHITSFRITQPSPVLVRQVRVERSDGGYKVVPANVFFSGTGNGTFSGFIAGYAARPGMLMISALTPTTFSVTFLSAPGTFVLGVATVGRRFNSDVGSFTISAGSTPFVAGDLFSAQVELDWYRVDVVNLPDVPVALINIKQSAASRYWRLVPTMFLGGPTDSWTVSKLELFDYAATTLDNIQDPLFMENRDRDYATSSIQLKAAYQPFDGMSDMSKFGFQVPDVYTFTLSFAEMVRALGRPIVVGDVIDLPSEMQYDHHLRPVRKFIEVNDVGWSAEGHTTGWMPIMYRFSAQQLIPSQEHRDLLGTIDTQKYVVDDGSFFNGLEQIQTTPLTVTEANEAEARQKVPEQGTNVRELASGTNRFGQPGSYDGVGPYVEDGLPPDGQPYLSGFKLPDVSSGVDGQFFRLEYDPQLNIAARLYKFSGVKNKWIFVETDRRGERSAHRPSQIAILQLGDQRPLGDKL
jgi:hypothetical protein